MLVAGHHDWKRQRQAETQVLPQAHVTCRMQLTA